MMDDWRYRDLFLSLVVFAFAISTGGECDYL